MFDKGLELTLQDSGPPGPKFPSPDVVCRVISCTAWNEILLHVKLHKGALFAHHFG